VSKKQNREPKTVDPDPSTVRKGFANHIRPDIGPRELMKKRRPELFSDSQILQEPLLTKEIFSHHLETLTARNQEREFEVFCKRLCQAEVCPNLLPQTGPTGGGDSKTDASTYPVAESITDRWFEGRHFSSPGDKWAFAFSAKKEFKSKIKQDVDKIAKTDRNYTHIFCVSNQFIRDKLRAELEDELSNLHKINITIFDRNWIIEQVFANRRFQLASETLGIDEVNIETIIDKGPQDLAREAELKALDSQISDPENYQHSQYQLIEDVIDAALLARTLDKPRNQIEARLNHAKFLAEKNNSILQLSKVLYNLAWTEFWWFEDIPTFCDLYAALHDLIFENNMYTVWELENLQNLWCLANSLVVTKKVDGTVFKFDRKTETLQSALREIADEGTSKVESLWAQSLLLGIGEFTRPEGPQFGEEFSTKMREIIEGAKGLPTFPIGVLFKFVLELGAIAKNTPAFDEMIETITSISGDKSLRESQSKLLYQHGLNKIKSEQYISALKYFWRCQALLALSERDPEFSRTLISVSYCYGYIGLFWASKETLIVIVEALFGDFYRTKKLNTRCLILINRILRLEFRTPRMPLLLAWLRLYSNLCATLRGDEQQFKNFEEEYREFDYVFAYLLMKTNSDDIQKLGALPAVLERLGLWMSKDVMLFLLGHEKEIAERCLAEDLSNSEFLNGLTEAFGHADGVGEPQWGFSDFFKLDSKILGLRLIIEVDNRATSQHLGEAVLGVLEAMVADAEGILFPYTRQLVCRIEPSNSTDKVSVETVEEESGDLYIDIKHENVAYSELVGKEGFFECILEICFEILKCSLHVRDESEIFGLLKPEKMRGSAIAIAGGPARLYNIFGTDFRFDWDYFGKGLALLTKFSLMYARRRGFSKNHQRGRETPRSLKELWRESIFFGLRKSWLTGAYQSTA